MTKDQQIKKHLMDYFGEPNEKMRNVIWNLHLQGFFDKIISDLLKVYRVRPSFKDDVKLACFEKVCTVYNKKGPAGISKIKNVKFYTWIICRNFAIDQLKKNRTWDKNFKRNEISKRKI